MEVEVGRPIAPKVDAAPVITPKRRKKKASYKSMMKGMMKTQTPERDIEKERESLRKVTGGGTFSKIDRIQFERRTSEHKVIMQHIGSYGFHECDPFVGLEF